MTSIPSPLTATALLSAHISLLQWVRVLTKRPSEERQQFSTFPITISQIIKKNSTQKNTPTKSTMLIMTSIRTTFFPLTLSTLNAQARTTQRHSLTQLRQTAQTLLNSLLSTLMKTAKTSIPTKLRQHITMH